MAAALCTLYVAILLVLSIYGIHRSYLVLLARKLRPRLAELAAGVPELPLSALTLDSSLPYVTVQLPLFNEATVAPRLLNEIGALEYPRDRLEIQVLDDSTDETCTIVQTIVDRMRATGLDIVYLHRTDRTGYKAGALDAGLKVAKGEFVALFDADFLPPSDFLRRVIPHFDDPKVAVVQGRWGHLNRDHSMLTRVAALMLDGHHLIENRVRAAADWIFNFAGTAGIWRKEAINAAGGWQHDTLTEDLDLSYRAHLAGWKFVYRENIVAPAELPEDVSAFRTQQFRWACGTVQTSRKLLKRIFRSNLSFGAKAEAFFHLTPHFAYPLTMVLSLLLLPMVIWLPGTDPRLLLLVDLPLFFGTTGSLAAFYIMAERAQGRRARDAMYVIPALIAVGVGLTPLITKALFRGYREFAGEFVRTPKKGEARTSRYRMTMAQLPIAEVLLALVSWSSVAASIATRHIVAAPFATLFACGYSYMALRILGEQFATTETRLPALETSARRAAHLMVEATEEEESFAA